MRATIDDAGRVVIPKPLREEIGLTPGPVEVVRDGAAIRIEPVTGGEVVERGGRLVIPASGIDLDDDAVREHRFADQQ